MIAIGGAIGTGLFLGSGFAIGIAGPAVLLSYFVGACITLLLMGCMAEMTVAHPTAGSFGAWAEFMCLLWPDSWCALLTGPESCSRSVRR
jgi:AAT family amino acid transporter